MEEAGEEDGAVRGQVRLLAWHGLACGKAVFIASWMCTIGKWQLVADFGHITPSDCELPFVAGLSILQPDVLKLPLKGRPVAELKSCRALWVRDQHHLTDRS